MIFLNHLIKEHLIYEGLIHSVSIEKLQDMIEKWGALGNKVSFNSGDNLFYIDIGDNEFLTVKEINHLVKLLNNLGWFISSYNIGSDRIKFDINTFIRHDINSPISYFSIEAKYDLELNVKNYPILYHTSPSKHDSKIQKIGLSPRTKSKVGFHPERIYFARNMDQIETLLPQFYDITGETNYSIFKIDMKSAHRRNRQIRLFKDSQFTGGVYTLSNIPPKYIQLVIHVDSSKF